MVLTATLCNPGSIGQTSIFSINAASYNSLSTFFAKNIAIITGIALVCTLLIEIALNSALNLWRIKLYRFLISSISGAWIVTAWVLVTLACLSLSQDMSNYWTIA